VTTLQELADRREIEDQLVAYSYAVDFRCWDDLDQIFTADATLDFTATGGEKGDLPAIKAWFDTTLGMFAGYQHLIGNVRVSITGDTATSIAACHNPMWIDDHGRTRLLQVGLWYRDAWRRTSDGWCICAREQQKGYMHGM
jgi:hypothetical protein